MPSREEIIKSLEDCMDVHRSGLWSSGCMSCAYAKQSNPKCFMNLTKDAVALLREQPAKDTNVPSKWISVKDRMPETEQIVLVSIKTPYGNRYTTVAAHIGYHERNNESVGWSLEYEIDWEYDEEKDVYWIPECWYEVNFVDDNPNWIIDKVDGEITHWMPLPEPPEVMQDGIQ